MAAETLMALINAVAGAILKPGPDCDNFLLAFFGDSSYTRVNCLCGGNYPPWRAATAGSDEAHAWLLPGMTGNVVTMWMARRAGMSLRKQFATAFSDWRDMPPRKRLMSDGSPQARHCTNLARLGGELDSALGAFPKDIPVEVPYSFCERLKHTGLYTLLFHLRIRIIMHGLPLDESPAAT